MHGARGWWSGACSIDTSMLGICRLSSNELIARTEGGFLDRYFWMSTALRTLCTSRGWPHSLIW